jgi:hypothetical protein
MKTLINGALAVLFVCSLISCQKNSDTSAQLIGDTVLTKCTMYYHDLTNNDQYPIRVNFWTTGKELSKVSIEPGDTLFNFVRNEKGDLTSFKEVMATIQGAITYSSTCEFSYAGDKITMSENWQSFENGNSGVDTRVFTLKDSVITSIEEYHDQKLWEKTDYYYDELGNVTKEMQSVANVTITYTYFQQYKNPLMINGQCRLINSFFGGGSYMSPNYLATETSTVNGTTDPKYTSIAKYVVNDHWGSLPTKVHASSDAVTIDYTYDYTIK